MLLRVVGRVVQNYGSTIVREASYLVFIGSKIVSLLHKCSERKHTHARARIMSTTTSTITSSSYAFAYDSSISNEHREIERIVHFYPEKTPPQIQCETSAFLCGLDAFMSTFDEEDEDKNESSARGFIGAKVRGKFYAAVKISSSIWNAVVVDSRKSRLLRRHFSLDDDDDDDGGHDVNKNLLPQGNVCLRFLRETMEREVKDKLTHAYEINDDDNAITKWNEELARLIDRLGEMLNSGGDASSFAMGGAMKEEIIETKEAEGIAYVLEERQNRNGTFELMKMSTSKSLDALRLLSKRETMKLRDEVEAVLEEEESRSYARTAAIERGTRPGHDGWLWSRVNPDRTKRLFFVTERTDVNTLLQANDEVNNLDV